MGYTKISFKRHLAKSISYRIISSGIGFLAMWWISGSIEIGASFGVVELLYKPIQYYIHERIWYKWIKFGVINKPDKKIINSEVQEVIPKSEEVSTPPPPHKKVLNYNSNR